MPSQGQSVVDVVCPNSCHAWLLTSKPGHDLCCELQFLLEGNALWQVDAPSKTCQNPRTNIDHILTSESPMMPFADLRLRMRNGAWKRGLETMSLHSRLPQKRPQNGRYFFTGAFCQMVHLKNVSKHLAKYGQTHSKKGTVDTHRPSFVHVLRVCWPGREPRTGKSRKVLPECSQKLGCSLCRG